ncbi:M23 family metallopeptidase [Streptomyces sp. WZ-12]|uniref:M23 family metallopeptidase n=1 Tax=Streptomyces sp. WZ-12 TaxID=3030210 RepID=UPI002380DA1B|nr:M23 family metallopeptidase [Streptomyces sp. WZ-12]
MLQQGAPHHGPTPEWPAHEGVGQGGLADGGAVHGLQGGGVAGAWGTGDERGVDEADLDEAGADEEGLRALRGKHRVARQRSGGLARGGTALGVGVIAAVGASGVAAAEGRPPAPISMPDPGGTADDAAVDVPNAPVAAASTATDAFAPPAHGSRAGGAPAEAAQGAGAAEALRNRILQQGGVRPADAQADVRADAQQGGPVGPEAKGAAATQESAPQKPGAEEASETEEAPETGTEETPAATQAPEPDAKTTQVTQATETTQATQTSQEPAAPAARPASPASPEADQPARPAQDFVAPVSSHTLATGFGQAGDRWAADHTGQDLAAPTGTLVKAVHDGTITQAGWAGAYGYRIVVTLDDGTELWFCHLSSMVKTSGRVHTGEVIGRVGATGNATTPHLHLEVRPHGGAPIDPVPWLRDRGVTV